MAVLLVKRDINMALSDDLLSTALRLRSGNQLPSNPPSLSQYLRPIPPQNPSIFSNWGRFSFSLGFSHFIFYIDNFILWYNFPNEPLNRDSRFA